MEILNIKIGLNCVILKVNCLSLCLFPVLVSSFIALECTSTGCAHPARAIEGQASRQSKVLPRRALLSLLAFTCQARIGYYRMIRFTRCIKQLAHYGDIQPGARLPYLPLVKLACQLACPLFSMYVYVPTFPLCYPLFFYIQSRRGMSKLKVTFRGLHSPLSTQ